MANTPSIMVAPNGARRGKEDHPLLPITIEETVITARDCYEVGATALHLHIRDAEGNHSLDAGRYSEAISELSNALPDMPVQITTEAFGIFSVEEQLSCLKDTAPKWASISVREIAREPDMADSVYGLCEENNTEVQHILYDEQDAQLLDDWLKAGIVREEQRSVLLVLGRYTQGQNSDAATIKPFLEALPSVLDWMLCAFGPQEHACLVEGAKLGGNCRVGFENSMINAYGEVWPDNQTSVAALKEAMKE